MLPPTHKLAQVALSLHVLWPEDVEGLERPLGPSALAELASWELLAGDVIQALQPAAALLPSDPNPSEAGVLAPALPADAQLGLGDEEMGLNTAMQFAAAEAFFGDDDEAPPTLGGAACPTTFVPRDGRYQRAFDPGLLSSRDRSVVSEAALTRRLWGEGVVDREAAVALAGEARERKVLLAELLRQRELVSAEALRNLTRPHPPLPVCRECLFALPHEYPDSLPCSACGARGAAPPSTQGSGSETFGFQSKGGFTEHDSDSGVFETEGGRTKSGRLTPNQAFAAGGSFANYELLQRVAEGGMGVVFKARERSLNRLVALKIMRGGALSSKTARGRFLAEAEAAAALDHPNIVPIHQIGEMGGYPFYTMDYVEGLPLDRWAENAEQGPRRIAALMRRVAEAVHHFHLRGIIHRDLKPDNILVTEAGDPRVIDFGIAKILTADDESGSWTLEGEILGTPHYMPPEQAAGHTTKIDTRSDVYALGAILYQLLSGERPFHDLKPLQVIKAIEKVDPRPLALRGRREDSDIEAIVAKAMARERARRYQSALELAEDLERYLAYEPIRARRAGWADRARKVIRRHPTLAAVALVSVLLVSLGSLFALQRQLSWRADVSARLARAQSAPLEERVRLLGEVLALDPENALAKVEQRAAINAQEAAERQEANEERLAAADERRTHDLRLAEERRKAELAKAALGRERERQRVRLLEEAERTRRAAIAEGRARDETRARQLLGEALSEASTLDALDALTDALALVPESSGALGGELARAKVARCVTLAKQALADDQAGLASYWLNQAAKLRAAKSEPPAEEIASLTSAVHARAQGLDLLVEARAAIQAERWLLARDKLSEARRRGVQGSSLEGAEATVSARCARLGQEGLTHARQELVAGRTLEALKRARLGATYLGEAASDEARELIFAIAGRLAQEGQRRSALAWDDPARRPAELEHLRDLTRLLAGTPSQPLVAREVALRRRLVSDAALNAECFLLPELGERGVGPILIQRAEVSNAAYLRFVRAKDYADPSLWDPRVTPPRAPSTWRDGTYGEAANAQRPVRGVSYYEARAYARWLTRHERERRWRLLSAKEWSVAAAWDPHTDTLRAYPWGSDYAQGKLPEGQTQPLARSTTPFDRSPLGGRDFGGSVSEWVMDDGRPGLKGASFLHAGATVRHLALVRTTGHPEPIPPPELSAALGFRLACEVTQQ